MARRKIPIVLDGAKLDELQRRFGLYKYGVEEAARHATRDTVNGLKGEFGAMLASRIHVSAAALQNRITLRYGYRTGTGRIWFGISPMSLASLGAVQAKTGVTAGPVTRAGAFIVQKLNGQVFKRDPLDRSHIIRQDYDITEESREVVENDIFPKVRGLFFFNLNKRLAETTFGKR